MTTGSSRWDFWNSNIVIFVLSTIVLGLLSLGYSTCRDYKASERLRVETVRKLDLEIAHRALLLASLLKDEISDAEYNSTKGAIFGDAPSDFYPMFPEYKGRSLASLLWELKNLLPEKEAKEIDKPLEAAKTAPVFIKKVKKIDTVSALDDKKQYENSILYAFKIGRWVYFT
ncbi:MAG TPA: hypothetical protein VD835_18820 [Pyrinomonadaceae bacterium]|nr:hypothetical protein [Pyrinomonadaceae bacterium]